MRKRAALPKIADGTVVDNMRALSAGELLKQGLVAMDCLLDDARQSQLSCFIDTLLRWNRVFNLTGARTVEELIVYHILDSLAVGPLLRGPRIVDVGTGAGLPGIPLAIRYPQWEFVLLDSNRRKVRFLEQTVIHLGLGNVSVESRRIQEYQPDMMFNSVISRAFASLADLVADAGKLCAETGQVLAMKGRIPEDELRSLPPAYRVASIERLVVPHLVGERHVVCVARS